MVGNKIETRERIKLIFPQEQFGGRSAPCVLRPVVPAVGHLTPRGSRPSPDSARDSFDGVHKARSFRKDKGTKLAVKDSARGLTSTRLQPAG